MKRSTERLLTTHAGSLPRPDDLLELLWARERGEAVDERTFTDRLGGAVAASVRTQVEHGLDIVDDGEMGKASFLTYANERLDGFEPSRGGPGGSPFAGSREFRSFPEFYQQQARRQDNPAASAVHYVCTRPITYTGQARVRRDIDLLKAVMSQVDVEEAFLPAIAPADIEFWNKNEYYATDEDYLMAIAGALHEEYRAIVEAGLLLQIDDPRLVTYYATKPDASVKECRAWAEVRVEALNHALRDLPRDRIRFHTCYSINMGPRVHDMELKDIVDIILKVRAGAYSFEAGNPRHEHEWRVWEQVQLPQDAVLIPGVITHSTVLVEHPEAIAERIERFASVVGRENVIAGADCGFATFAGTEEIHPTVAWAKLDALVAGAELATERLWGRAGQRKSAD
jgi:5-methyltetrahydropteroyltriglutamate--homocysteine methyltransferase